MLLIQLATSQEKESRARRCAAGLGESVHTKGNGGVHPNPGLTTATTQTSNAAQAKCL